MARVRIYSNKSMKYLFPHGINYVKADILTHYSKEHRCFCLLDLAFKEHIQVMKMRLANSKFLFYSEKNNDKTSKKENLYPSQYAEVQIIKQNL